MKHLIRLIQNILNENSNIVNKMTITAFKNYIESETGLKVSVSEPKGGSMGGYVVFSAKKVNGEYPEWDIDFARTFRKQYPGDDNYPTFANKSTISIFKRWYVI